MISFKKHHGETLEEGVNDPAIFKVVFTAGGPGSGKSFTAHMAGLVPLGFKVINIDPAFEKMMKDAGLDTSKPNEVFSDKGQQIRKLANNVVGTQKKLALEGRLGLLIDGTGKDYNKIKSQVVAFRRMGYECAMIFVNTDLETAINRDIERGKGPGGRTLGKPMVSKMWKDVQKNIGKFQNLFKGQMYIVDNNEGTDIRQATLPVYRKISAWAKKEPRMPQAKAWITAARMKKEEHGAGDRGTDELVSNFKADTPGENGKKVKITKPSTNDELLQEGIAKDLLKDIAKIAIGKKRFHDLKRMVNKDKYKFAVTQYRKMKKDVRSSGGPEKWINKHGLARGARLMPGMLDNYLKNTAADLAGITPKEFNAVLNRNTRYK